MLFDKANLLPSARSLTRDEPVETRDKLIPSNQDFIANRFSRVSWLFSVTHQLAGKTQDILFVVSQYSVGAQPNHHLKGVVAGHGDQTTDLCRMSELPRCTLGRATRQLRQTFDMHKGLHRSSGKSRSGLQELCGFDKTKYCLSGTCTRGRAFETSELLVGPAYLSSQRQDHLEVLRISVQYRVILFG